MWFYSILLLSVAAIVVRAQLTIDNNFKNMMVRLNTINATPAQIKSLRAGRVEVSFDFGITWGTICSTTWSMREGNVVCRQLGLGYASVSTQTDSTVHGNSRQYPWAMVGTLCRGNERKLSDCFRESRYPSACNAANRNVSIVACVPRIADLQLGLADIGRRAYLELVPMTRLTCAMEENCLSRDAYEIRRHNPNAQRKLLRFAVRASNVGTADFSPYANYRDWVWHQCHMHYHSMNVFATFDIYNKSYKKVAQGHKASFCLMDSECERGIRPRYTCGNRMQGISIGCSDVYTEQLDCQWVDVTNLAINRRYILRVALNPEYMIGEITFENNGAECDLFYTGESATTKITNCKLSPLWFKR